MTIGELAKLCGVNVETIRFYERKKLIRDPRPGGTGYRDFTTADARRLIFIRKAQQLGFTLHDINELLELRVSGSASCSQVESAAKKKIEDIEGKIRTLEGFKAALDQLVEKCEASEATAACPILDALEEMIDGELEA